MPGSEVAMNISTSGCLEQFVRDCGADVRVQQVKEKRLCRGARGGCGRKEALRGNNQAAGQGKRLGKGK